MPKQYRELCKEGERALKEIALPDAALDARLLLEEVCGTDLQTLLVYPDKIVTKEEEETYRALILRRLNREPTAMILGKWEFMGLPFKVTHDTLIPEQDTEVLAEKALQLRDPPERILDLCTGSGCILLSLLHFFPKARGIGTDLSQNALAVALENARSLGLEERAQFLFGDLWDALESPSEVFDLIVSNPPYVPSKVIDTLEPEVKTWEPRMALDGGEDGLSFYRKIIGEAQKYLTPGGVIIVESGFDEAARIRGLFRDAAYEEIRTANDYGGLERVVSARKPLLQ